MNLIATPNYKQYLKKSILQKYELYGCRWTIWEVQNAGEKLPKSFIELDYEINKSSLCKIPKEIIYETNFAEKGRNKTGN